MPGPITLPNLDAPEGDVVSRHELRRYLAGELSATRRAELEAQIGAEPALRARLDAVAAEERAEDAAFRLEVPLPRFLEDHERRTRGTNGGLLARLVGLRIVVGGSALAAAAVALFFVVRTPSSARPNDEAWDGLKGGARLGFFVRQEEGARLGVAGEELRPGDQIQFAVRDDEQKRSMVIVGIDSRGAVSVYAAEDLRDVRAKGDPNATGPRLLAASVVLDDAVGPERFFAVYGDIELDAVRRAAEDAARELVQQQRDLTHAEKLALPSTWTQSTIHIRKVTR